MGCKIHNVSTALLFAGVLINNYANPPEKKNIDHTVNNITKIKVWSDIRDLVYIFQEGYNYRSTEKHGVFDYYPCSKDLKFNVKKG